MVPSKQGKEFDLFYLIIGKALFIASDFENELKGFHFYLQIKTDPSTLSNPENLNEFFEKYNPPSNMVKEIGFKSDLKKMFKEAIKSRNYIAHQLGLAVYNYDSDEFSINDFIEREVKPHIENILIVHSLLKRSFAEINKEAMPVKWIERQKKWIYNSESDI